MEGERGSQLDVDRESAEIDGSTSSDAMDEQARADVHAMAAMVWAGSKVRRREAGRGYIRSRK